MFFVYLKYLTTNLFKNIFVYFSTVFAFVITVFVLFGLPSILKLSLDIISNYIYFFILVMMLGVFNVSTFVSAIFRQSIDDGSELILQSKPISRTLLAYTKIVLFLLVILIVSLFNSLLGYFTTFYTYGGVEIGKTLALNFFLGTIAVYSFFGSLAVLFCMFFKQIVTIILTSGVFMLLMIYALIANNIFMSVSKYLRRNDNLYLTPVSLVLQESNNELSYYGGASGAINSSNNYITPYIYEKLNLNNNDIKANQYLQYKWQQTIDNNNYLPYIYTNFIYQLGKIYTNKPASFAEQPFSSLSYLMRSSSSFDINLKFRSIESLTAESPLILTYNNESFYLTNNTNVTFVNSKTQQTYSTSIITSTNKGQVSFFSSETLLPVAYINNQVVQSKFDYSQNNNLINTLKLFANTYLSDNILPNLQNKFNYLSLFATYFNSLNLQRYINENQMSLVNYQETQNITKILDDTSRQITKFHYLSFLTYKNKEQLNLSDKQIESLVNILNLNQSNSAINKSISSVIVPIDKLNDSDILNSESFYSAMPFFDLINSDFLNTFNFVDVSNFFQSWALISSWMLASSVLLCIATMFYFKHDFY